MSYIETWDETKPAGSRDANLGDDDIREFKRAIRERLAGGGMYFPSTDDANAGLFNYLKFIEQSGNPTSGSDRGFLFTKDVSGVTELYWMDSAGTVVQLTSGGKILIGSLGVASQAQGDIIYFNGTSWVRLGAGTSGHFLKTNGAAANPAWAAALTSVATSDLPSGTMLQEVYTESNSYSSGSTATPQDDTIPQNTEGDQYLSLAITPLNSSNYLEIEATLALGYTPGGGAATVALHQDSTANALKAWGIEVSNSDQDTYTVKARITAGTTSATTFKIRVGPLSGKTIYFNGNGSLAGRLFGGVCCSSMTIREIKA